MSSAIHGWRSWDFDLEKHRLCSVFHECVWPPCERAEADGPLARSLPGNLVQHTKKGIHAWNTPTGWDITHYPHLLAGIPVWGQVSLWGDVVIHDHGYRAQYAYPYAVYLRPKDASYIPLIRDLYIIDVEVAPDA